MIKALPLTFAGFRPIAEAIITMGGVKVGEVSPKTMESKRLPGLYFAGAVSYTHLGETFKKALAKADGYAIL